MARHLTPCPLIRYSLRIARGELVSMYDLDAATLSFVMETFEHTPTGANPEPYTIRPEPSTLNPKP